MADLDRAIEASQAALTTTVRYDCEASTTPGPVRAIQSTTHPVAPMLAAVNDDNDSRRTQGRTYRGVRQDFGRRHCTIEPCGTWFEPPLDRCVALFKLDHRIEVHHGSLCMFVIAESGTPAMSARTNISSSLVRSLSVRNGLQVRGRPCCELDRIDALLRDTAALTMQA
ncbi:hypothetical protein [Amycolatopsis sp. lyj-109]|uniref:hypothetical protein n=1 Tax=Amycolatopsis sp. lyj-109 TaxID=2789287 RepID=UPI00397933D4